MLTKKYIDLVIGIIIVFLLVGLVNIAIPMDFPYIFNFDESSDLTQSYLLSRNYHFFTEVWIDHLLGLPTILKLASNFIKINLSSARHIVLLFSAINILVFYTVLRRDCHKLASIIATLILISSFFYVPLSGTVFKEIPCLAFALLSVLFMEIYAQQKGKLSYLYLFLSSLSFIIAQEIKLSCITIIPSLVFLGFSSPKKLPKKLVDAAGWAISASLIFLCLSVTILPFSYENIIGFHRNASAKLAISDPSQTLETLIKTGFQYDTIYALLGIVAILSIIWTDRRTKFIPPLLWLGCNLLRFSLMSPVWSNYYIDLAVPIAWLIAIFLDDLELETVFKEWKTKNLKASKLIVYGLMLVATFLQFTFNTARIVTASNPKRYRHPLLASYNQMAKNYQVHPVEKFLAKYQNSNKVILTDNSYYIHKFKLDTIPETAFISRKRLITENIDGDFILKIIQERKPDFVYLDRFVDEFMKSKNLTTYLQENYVEYPLPDHQERLFVLPAEAKGFKTIAK